jgi:S1-C subfamily serine protease
MQDLFQVLSKLEAGKTVKVGVLRGEEHLTIEVTLADRPRR